MFCTECGTKIEINQKFCKNCGSRIKLFKENEVSSNTSQKSKTFKNSQNRSSKKNYIFYALGFGLFNILIMAPVGGLPYAIGYALPAVLILLAASNIPNKKFRKVTIALLSFFFLIIMSF